jgi:magnesium transporter
MHSSELADILEDLGAKERQGVVESLETTKAARAIEKTEGNTQEAILEELPRTALKNIIGKMHVANLANVFYKLNPLRTREMVDLMDKEKAGKVEKLLDFGSYTAGGAMRTGFIGLDGNTTVKETFSILYKLTPKPEAIVVTNGNGKLVGTIHTKDILDSDSLAILKDLVTERKFVYPETDFNEVISLFGRYNLRALPVVDKERVPIGIVTVGIVLSKIEEKTQTDEII